MADVSESDGWVRVDRGILLEGDTSIVKYRMVNSEME